MVQTLGEQQYNISRHLGVLRQAGLVEGTKCGVQVSYSISPALSPQWRAAIHCLCVAWDEADEVADALSRVDACTKDLSAFEPG